jgi:hypothetical protein
MSSDPASEGPTTIVDVAVGDGPADQALGAVDAVLECAAGDVAVRILVAEDHPGRGALAELCAADPRLRLADPGADPGPCEVRVSLPPAARPSGRTLAAIEELLAADSVRAVEVATPGRIGALGRTALAARLFGAKRVRAERPGMSGRTVRVSARRVGLGSSRAPVSEPPPRAPLSQERAEHLRHRARSATGRARFDRNSQRLTRERLRFHHERSRAALLDERLAAVSPRHRVGRWIRKARRLALAVPLRLWSLAKAGRVFIRRGRRFLVDQVRQRRSPAPRQQSR